MLNILIVICGACMMYHTEYADNGMQKMSVLRDAAGENVFRKVFHFNFDIIRHDCD